MRRCDTGEEAVMARWGILCPGCEGSLFRMANGGSSGWRGVLGVMIWAGMMVILLGCGLVDSGPAPSATPVHTVGQSPTSLPSAAPTVVPTLQPSPTVNACPQVQSAVLFPDRPVGFPDEYVEMLRQYLAVGGDIAGLKAGLTEWAALPPEGSPPVQKDLTGDGSPETVVAFVDPLAPFYPPEGVLVVYTCRDGTVERLYTYALGEYLYPSLVGAEDLTQDGVADLAYTEVSCGAHTCWHIFHVWSWTGVTFEEQMGDELMLPYPTFSLVDGQIVGGGGGIGSVGAGPQRVYTETWAWDGHAITWKAEEPGPVVFRFHALVDGDEAFRAQHYADALTAYSRVLTDEALEAWGGYYGAEEEALWLKALARWRLLTLNVALGNSTEAEVQYRQLQADFMPEMPGYSVVLLAQRFWQQYQASGNSAAACSEVMSAMETSEVLEFLNSFGYANPTYEVEDLCLF